MNAWLLFALFLVIGLGMLIVGLYYMRKEKKDPDSVKFYRIVTILGALITLGAILYRVLL